MMGIKRNLFPEISVDRISEVAVMPVGARRIGKPGSDKQKTKRNATTTAINQGDSLANVLLGKQNIASVKTRKLIRQRKEISQKQQRDTKNQVFKPSVLMVLDAKENICDNNEGNAQIHQTRPKKANLVPNCPTKSIVNRRDPSNTAVGGVLVCLGTENRFGLSSLVSSRGVRQTRPSAKIARRSKAKEKCGRRNDKKKKVTKRVRREDSIPNGDSLMTSLAGNSSNTTESILVGTEFTQKPTKPRDERRKRTEKRTMENGSSAVGLTDTHDAGKKPQNHSRRSKVASCEVGGLGAFVGINGAVLNHRNSRKEKCAQRLVSPEESDLKTNSIASMNSLGSKSPKEERDKMIQDTTSERDLKTNSIASMKSPSLKSSKQEIDKMAKDTTSDTSSLDEIPSVITISLPPQTVRLQQRESLETTSIIETQLEVETEPIQDDPVTEPSNVERRQCVRSSEINNTMETRSENLSPKESKGNNFVQKFSLGTQFQKNFKFHGWFVGKIVNFDSETGFYKVLYEDGDVEELEESELEKCKLQLDSSAGAPVRRSRRRSSEPSRHPDNPQSTTSRKSEVRKSVRRSKRRKSQPTRLVYSDCSDSKQTARFGGSKETEISDQMSNSNHNHKRHEKEHFDDALRAVMPIEDNTTKLAHDPGQIKDDIFNSTPMRKLFTRSASKSSDSNATKQSNEENSKPKRRSRRRSLEPERYGYDTDIVNSSKKPADNAANSSKKPVKSSMKKRKRKRGSLTAKKRVRISNEMPKVTKINSHEKAIETDMWTKSDIKALHRAHRTVDPTSFSFWEDVSELIGDRSAIECRQKWFSLAKTPEPKKQKQKKKDDMESNTEGDKRSFDDDIFNSTPMRSAFAIGENINISSTAFEELGDITNINVGSAIKIVKRDPNDESMSSNPDQIACPHGYKTYLQKMGRIMRQKDTKKKQMSGRTNQHLLVIGKKLAERTNEGDVQVKGRLSPGGTLQVDTFGDTDTEDYLDYEEDTE